MKRRILFAVIAAAVLAGCSEEEPAEQTINVITNTSTSVTTTAATTSETTTVTTPEPPPTEATVSFTALGDNLIHSSLYNQAAKRAAADEECELAYDFERAYAGAADLLDRADITVLNQETLICGEGFAPSSYPRFNSPVELGDYMAELGVDVFTMANNHMLDMNESGLYSCLSYYDERGYMRVGAYLNKEDRDNIRVLEKNGVRISFLSYTESLNGLHLAAGSELELGLTSEKDVMLSEIAKAEEISDICVVSLHWGTENSSTVEEYQRVLAKELAEAGADVIIGNHPHVLREIEIIENPDGSQTLCAYSLGNFISAQNVGKNLIGGVLDFDITVQLDGEPRPRVTDMEFIPVITHYDRGYSDIRLYKLSDYTPELAAAHGVKAYSSFSYDYVMDYLEEKGLLDMK